jgi:hypothetical protein
MNGLITLKFRVETSQRLAEMTAHSIMRDHKRWSMVEALESEITRVYNAYEAGGYSLPITKPTGPNRSQTTMRVSPTAYDHLLMTQAHVMMQTKGSVKLFHLIHSIVMSALTEFN